MKKFQDRALLAITLSLLLCSGAARGDGGGMKIFPLGTYFSDGVRSQHLNIVNSSERAATFRAEFAYEKQNPDGSPVYLDGPPDPNFDLSKMVIYSPRQIFLQPGDVQSLKLAIHRPENFPEGEQRIYLRLSRMDNNGPRMRMEQSGGAPENRIRGEISMNVSYNIPVIVRHGKSDTVAKIGNDFKFSHASADGKRPETLDFTIRRSGRFSSIGRARIYWTPPGGVEKPIGGLSNANIFPENDHRMVTVPLTEKSLPGGSLRIVYEGNEDGPDKGVIFDEKVVSVAQIATK